MPFEFVKDMINLFEWNEEKKKQLILKCLIDINKVQAMQLLKKAAIEVYGVFEGKNPKLPKTDINQRILSVMQDKKWISSYTIDSRDDSYYRANSKKFKLNRKPETKRV